MSDTDRAQAELSALSEAVLAITSELGLDKVLNRLVEIAANLVNAKYAALGVPDGKGGFAQFLTHGMNDDEVDQIDHYPLGLGLLGALLVDTAPIRIANLMEDPRSAGFCQHHPLMSSFLGVPIISKGNHLGSLYLCDRHDGQPFSADDERVMSLLAAHAAIAIENARLFEQARTLAVMEERNRISLDLHDGIIQAIYAIGLNLELAKPGLPLDSAVSREIDKATQDLNQVIENLRAYIRNLEVGVEPILDLKKQVDDIVTAFKQVSTAHVTAKVAYGFTKVDKKRVQAIVHIMREALSNINRHASATEVTIELHESPTQLALAIIDNGNGFQPDEPSTGSGLRNIRQRVAQLGGTVDIDAKPGSGVALHVMIPLVSPLPV